MKTLVKSSLKKILPKKVLSVIHTYRTSGFVGVNKAIKKKKYKREWNKRNGFYIPVQAFGISSSVINAQKKEKFSKDLKFSILVPLYNTPEAFLREMISSVLFQTYSNWELCLADGSDESHKYIQEICEKISKKDHRIKYKKLDKNGGISGNTNECLKMAVGDYISLFDHDDLLHPCALFETMKAICKKNAEIVYTDETIFLNDDIFSIVFPIFKIDYNIKQLETSNYFCHFLSFKKNLVGDNIFDAECDGAQDYDLVLKLVEKTNKIIHVAKCLYFWRSTPVSTSSGTSAKPYTSIAGKKALEKHFNRLGQNVKVDFTEVANIYKCLYEDGTVSNPDMDKFRKTDILDIFLQY